MADNNISISAMIQKEASSDSKGSIIMPTHLTREEYHAAIARIESYPL